jgi:hypothetical protein
MSNTDLYGIPELYDLVMVPNAAAEAFYAEAALRLRVGQAAQVLREQGINPTVARIRQALGGGSPNDLAPALRSWREGLPAGDPARSAAIQQHGGKSAAAIPPVVTDIARELWQSALAAAALELKYGQGHAS